MLSLSPAAKLDYERDLNLVRVADDFEGGEAFRRLWDRVVVALKNGLVANGLSADDAEDHLQAVRIRLWERRRTLDVRSPGAWWSLVRKVSHNLIIDHARTNRHIRSLAIEDVPDIPERDMPYVDAIVLAANDLRRIYDAADDLWLGETPNLDDTALLAVQLCVVEGFDRQSAAHLLQTTPEQIDRWMQDPALLRHLIYRELFWTNDALAGYVLRPEKPYTPSQLDELVQSMQEAEKGAIDGWDWKEVLIVLLRVRNGLLTEQILRFEKCEMDSEDLEDVLRRIRDRFPFEKIATQILKKLSKDFGQESFDSAGLWKRLAFQYHVSSELPNRQIVERTEPAAAIMSHKVTEAMLNNWIGLGRLWSQLAAHVKQGEAA